MKKKWISMVSALLVLSLACNVSAAAAAENTTTTTNLTSYGADYLTKTDGSFWVWGGNRSVPTQIHDLNEVQAYFGSQYVMKKDLSVWQWRTSAYSEAVKVTPVQELDNLVDMFMTGNRTIALKGDGTILSAPLSSDGLTTSAFTPISGVDNVAAVGGYYESDLHKSWTRYVFLKKDGTVSTTRDDFESFETIQNLTDIIQIKNNLALKKDGSIWSWPVQDYYKNQGAPIDLSATPLKGISNIKSLKGNQNSLLAIDGASQLWFWGATITGSSDGTTYHEQPPILLKGIKNVVDAYIVERSIVALTGEGNVYQTSIENEMMPVDSKFTLLEKEVSSLKKGGRHIIMQKKDGSLWGWGVNKDAQLGYGDYEFSHAGPVPVQKPISISLNGESIPLSNGVITRNGQNFVPLRSLFEKLGATITYKENITAAKTIDKQIMITRTATDKPALAISINGVTGATMVNNKSVNLPTLPFIVNGSMYLPLRFISEQLGANVEWLPQEERIAITMQ
ncbi:stalk domain-containing protein [Paenibacillus sp. B2(2019)]|uniref:stalk domain-containing protein n=1 Tax=Paenibacillus sp. B2(2019) TaxID=2607754 RepID=UPI00165F1F1C|nr:stalk domain-containing protein [Paenibacillus sp. B2(2019)]